MTAKYNVYGIGNALVDVQYRVDPGFLKRLGIEKGGMTLVDQARLKAIVSALNDQPPERASGGSAANTVIALANLGGKACYACKVGRDPDGDFYLQDMRKAGVDTNDANRGDGPTGMCLVLITPDADRSMNTFLGVSSEVGPEQVEDEFMRQSDYFYIEGYLLSVQEGFEAVSRGQALARTRGTRVALTLSDVFIVNNFRERVRRIIQDGIDILFCNEAEALAYTEREDVEQACRTLSREVPRFAVTRGPNGALIGDAGSVFSTPGFKVKAVDTNGAGDMFAGAFLYGLTEGWDLKRCAGSACHASSRIVTHYGPRLPG